MLRTILIALAVLFALRLIARLAAPRAAARPAPEPEARPRKAVLSDAQRAELEAERERALREGRQVDAIEIHRKLTGLELADAKDEADGTRGRGTGR